MPSPSPMNQPDSDETIFAAALQWETPAQRAAYLEEACAGDAALRARVEGLLGASDEAKTFLERPVGQPRKNPAAPPVTVKVGFTDDPSEAPGARIGRYKLLQQIGEGGCGTVFMAEQEEPVRRRVALKVIKLGMDTKSVVARFEAERQALAMMDHPNIAKVLDAGATDSGRPFFVMELVRGIPITRYCDENKLDTRQRLDLFIKVCQAIQHAHQKGIIHRDIKPSNILVTLHDGVPVPKVIDFGIAKATEGRLTNATLFTAFEQFIGTPAYMSPEQAEMSGLDIDTRSDIYALGVLLYELLTGKTPFDAKELAQSGLDAMRKTIREREPQRPSTRLSTMQGEALATTATAHGSDAIRLLRLIRGDLDWIVMKCLEKDRTRRYETANGLAADLRRHLTHEPILARPPSAGYRFQKAFRRNKVLMSAAAVVALTLWLAVIVSLWQAVLVRRERDTARQERQQSEAINRFLTEDLLYQATPDQNARETKVTMEEVLERAARKLGQNPELARQPLLEATLRYDIGVTYQKLGLMGEAEQHLRRAVLLREQKLGPDHQDTLTAKLQLATLLINSLGRFEEGGQLSHEALGHLQRLVAQQGDAAASKLYRDGLDAMSLYAQALMHDGKLEKALELTRQNVADYARIFGPDDLDSINELQNLALVLGSLGDYAEAEQDIREALRRYGRTGKADDDNAINGVNSLALYRQYLGDLGEAERLLTEAYPRAVHHLGPLHPLTMHLEFRLARVLAEAGRLGEAEDLARKNLAARQQALPANNGGTAASMLLLGRIEVERAQTDPLAEAETLLQKSRTIFTEHLATKPELAAAAENWLGAIRLEQNDYPGAEKLLLLNADRLLEPTGELSPNERSVAIGHVVRLYQAWGKPGQAADWQRKLDGFARPSLHAKAGERTAIRRP